jgi:hypothetical protein
VHPDSSFTPLAAAARVPALPCFIFEPGFARGIHRVAFEVTGKGMPVTVASEAGRRWFDQPLAQRLLTPTV